MNTIPPDSELPPVPSTSLMARITNVFVSPAEVFEEVSAGPSRISNWLVPALIFVLMSWCAAGLMLTQPAIKQQMVDMQDQAMQKQLQKQIDSGKMTQAQVDQIKVGAAKYAGIGQIVGGFVVPVFQVAVALFGGGFILWIGAMLVFKQPFEFMKGVEVVGLSLVIVAVGALVNALLCAALGNMFASPSPALFIKQFDPTNPMHSGLAALNMFGLWALVVKSIGLARLSRISFARAAAWVVGAWIVITAGMITFGWAMQKVFAGMSPGN